MDVVEFIIIGFFGCFIGFFWKFFFNVLVFLDVLLGFIFWFLVVFCFFLVLNNNNKCGKNNTSFSSSFFLSFLSSF